MSLYHVSYRVRLHTAHENTDYKTKISDNFFKINFYRFSDMLALVHINSIDLEKTMNFFISYLTKDCPDIHNDKCIEVYYIAIPIDITKEISTNLEPTFQVDINSIPTWNIFDDKVENFILQKYQKEQN